MVSSTKPVSCPQRRSIHLHPCCSDVSWLHTREPHVAWVCLVAPFVEAHTIAERADRLEMLWLTSGAHSLIRGGRAAWTENCSCSLRIFRHLCCRFLREKITSGHAELSEQYGEQSEGCDGGS